MYVFSEDTFELNHSDREVVGYQIVCISKGNVTFRLVFLLMLLCRHSFV